MPNNDNFDNFSVPRMETIKTTAALLSLPIHFVRQKVTSGEVVAVRAGKRYLVNVDKFIQFLNSSTVSNESETAKGTKD